MPAELRRPVQCGSRKAHRPVRMGRAVGVLSCQYGVSCNRIASFPMSMSGRVFLSPLMTTAVAVVLCGAVTPASAACAIPDSPCYPWSIPDGEDETVLLEIIPNNTITGAVYRVCLCPPTNSVSIVFDFKEGQRTLGTIARRSATAICRDYRFQTARSSTLKIRRSDPDKAQDKGADQGLIEGCYMTY
jgi:hypothetical protein